MARQNLLEDFGLQIFLEKSAPANNVAPKPSHQSIATLMRDIRCFLAQF